MIDPTETRPRVAILGLGEDGLDGSCPPRAVCSTAPNSSSAVSVISR